MIRYQQGAAALIKIFLDSKSLENPISKEDLCTWLERPKNPEHGDIAFPCFRLSKPLGAPPKKICQELASELNLDESPFSGVVATGPYLNFNLGKEAATTFLREALRDRDQFGRQNSIGAGRKILLEYSSPNIAKEFHIGHFRNTVLGQSLCNLYRACGYEVIAINHLGDWGSQFGKIAYAFLNWGEESALEKNPLEYLTKLYVRFHTEAENNPDLDREARLLFKKIEANDPELKALWQRFVGISIETLKKTYARLGVHFDHYLGESFYIDKVDGVIQELRNTNLLEESEGAQVVLLEDYKMPPCIILTGDGTTLYHTRDLAAATYRKGKFQFDRCLYVVGSEQSLHFQQLFKVLELMGKEWHAGLEHVRYGLYRFKEGKFSTRKGQSILMAEVLEEARSKVAEIIANKNPNLPEKEEVAEMVALGAVIYNDLSTDRVKDVEFDWNRVLDFEGDTGPYLQYTYARASSILRKAAETGLWTESSLETLIESNEFCPRTMQLLKLLGHYSGSIQGAVRLNKPSIVANYVLELSKNFNSFYRNVKVLDESEAAETIQLRLAVVDAVRTVIRSALGLLCIRTPEAM